MRMKYNSTPRLLITTFAFALAVSPVVILSGITSLAGTAFAKDGSGGGGHDGDGGGSGSDHGGSGSGGSGSGSAGGGEHAGVSHDGNDDGVDHDANDDNSRDRTEHVGATGARGEAEGNKIEVVHANGVKEEIENGRFEVKDANGKTIVERRATRADIARLQALLP